MKPDVGSLRSVVSPFFRGWSIRGCGDAIVTQMLVRSVSLVVVAKLHNPSILNHDFLLHNKVIDESWGRPEDFISTPPLSAISYPKLRTRITCQEQRLQFDLDAPAGPEMTHLICDAIRRYVEILKYVNYIAFGMNFQFLVPVPDPVNVLTNQLLPTRIANLGLPTFDVESRLKIYPETGRPVSLTFSKGQMQEGGPFNAIQISTNSHFDLMDGLGELVNKLKSVDSIQAEVQSFAIKILGDEP